MTCKVCAVGGVCGGGKPTYSDLHSQIGLAAPINAAAVERLIHTGAGTTCSDPLSMFGGGGEQDTSADGSAAASACAVATLLRLHAAAPQQA